MSKDADNETTAPAAKKATKKKAKKKAKKKSLSAAEKAERAKEKARIAKEKEKQAILVQAMAEALYAVIDKAAPELTQTMMWGHQFYVGHKPVVGVALHDDHVNLVVYNGDEVEDPEGLMKGVGYNRSVRVNKVEEIGLRKAALTQIIQTSAQADITKKS